MFKRQTEVSKRLGQRGVSPECQIGLGRLKPLPVAKRSHQGSTPEHTHEQCQGTSSHRSRGSQAPATTVAMKWHFSKPVREGLHLNPDDAEQTPKLGLRFLGQQLATGTSTFYLNQSRACCCILWKIDTTDWSHISFSWCSTSTSSLLWSLGLWIF